MPNISNLLLCAQWTLQKDNILWSESCLSCKVWGNFTTYGGCPSGTSHLHTGAQSGSVQIIFN